MSDLTKITERIAKLLAMAKDSSSPEEAAIAAQRARKLMDQYQIDESDLPENNGKLKKDFGSAIGKTARAKIPTWQHYIAVAVAEYNDCIVRIISTRTNGGVVRSFEFLGYSTDAFLAAQLTDYLIATVNRLATAYAERVQWESFQSGDKVEGFSVLKNNYRKGAAVTLNLRLKALSSEREEELKSAGTSLMVLKKNHVEEHFGPAEYKETKTRVSSEDAFVAGAVAARNIALHKQVEQEKYAQLN